MPLTIEMVTFNRGLIRDSEKFITRIICKIQHQLCCRPNDYWCNRMHI